MLTRQGPKQSYINHIAIVIDESGSMQSLRAAVVKVVDGLISHLALRSKEMDQETRVTVYTFNNEPKCLIFDKDVLRLPSIADFYRPTSQTALIDAAILSQEDLALTCTKYGDHSFLTYVITDGQNNINNSRQYELANLLSKQADNWTVAVLVPDMNGKHYAKQYGFPADNIAIWDSTSATGVAEAGEVIRKATDVYMANRTKGTRGSRNLFTMDLSNVNASSVASLGITPLEPGKFKMIPIPPVKGEPNAKIVLKDFVEANGFRFQVGKNFYALSKVEKIQADKDVAIVHKKTRQVFVGHEARKLLGLPDHEVRIHPGSSSEYEIYIQSNSNNRHLVVGTHLLILAPVYA